MVESLIDEGLPLVIAVLLFNVVMEGVLAKLWKFSFKIQPSVILFALGMALERCSFATPGNLPQPRVLLLPHAYSTRIANTNSYLPPHVRVSHAYTRLCRELPELNAQRTPPVFQTFSISQNEAREDGNVSDVHGPLRARAARPCSPRTP